MYQSNFQNTQLQKLITKCVVIGIVVIGVLGIFGWFVGTQNKGVRLEETMQENLANINKEKTRKYSVFTNMVDAIQSYNKYEGETLEKVIAARNSGNVEEGTQLLNVLVEQYPELKSNENYKTYLTEVSVTENRIANYVENYNSQLREYNAWAKSFPVSLIYQKQQFDFYEDAKADIDIDGKLFSEE